MADQLVDALEEVQVGLRLHVERRGPERRRVEPRPRFRRDDGPVVQVPDGGGPPRRAQRLPLRAFAFGQIDAGVARDGGGRDAVALDAEPRAALRRPGLHGREEPLVEQVRQRASPVVADRGGGRPGVEHERGQQRPQVVPAARLERLEEVAGPVGLVHFEAVAEHGVGRRRVEGRQQAVADRRQIVVDGRAIVVIEDEPFGADRRALHHHAGAAADEEQDLARVRRTRPAGGPARRRCRRPPAVLPSSSRAPTGPGTPPAAVRRRGCRAPRPAVRPVARSCARFSAFRRRGGCRPAARRTASRCRASGRRGGRAPSPSRRRSARGRGRRPRETGASRSPGPGSSRTTG